MATSSSNSKKNPTDLQELAIEEGRKLGFLIAKSPVLTGEEKEALLNVLPEMDVEQLQQLTQVLEAQFANAATPEIDAATASKLQAVQTEYEESVASAQQQALKQMADLQKELID
jgi:transcriptional regulator of heat shock response